MEIPKKVAETIAKFSLLSPGERIIVGVSGGADSLCLTSCLNDMGYQVTMAHLDHQLRKESAQEARLVERIGGKLGLETIIEKGEVRELANRGYSIEEAARLVRYRFLARVANAKGAHTIATGHTADDQVETVLMHFLRGAGPSGLRGILPVTPLSDWVGIPGGEGILLVRPLLEIRRSQTEAYCRDIHLEPIQDPSNIDLSYFRNKIRHHLLPILREYNPGIDHIILRMAQIMEAEAEMVNDLLQEHWQHLVLADEDGMMKVNRKALEEMPVALQRSFIRRVFKQLRPEIRDMGFDHVERVVEFLTEPRSYQSLQLPAGLEILKISPDIAIFRQEGQKLPFPQYPQVQSQTFMEFTIPSSIALECGWMLHVDYKDLSEIDRANFLASLDHFHAAMDLNKVRGELHLRTLRPGDRISPLGMSGNLKVSDLFINNKIPKQARTNWPLIVDDEKILWVVGLRIADDCRVTSDTKKIVLFKAEPF